MIHHSHTDIGYTDRQEKIERNHVDFIKQAILIGEAGRSGERPEWSDFHWTCETFWAVERFLEHADESWHERFIHALHSGYISLSATYLNMTELPDENLLKAMLSRSVEFSRSIDLPLRVALTADINGYSWGYADVLAEQGIEFLFSCVHAVHGTYPLFQKQRPFWWKTPKGNTVLVWNGDHYNLGNELGIAPGAVHTYTIEDGLVTPPVLKNHWEVAERRLFEYVKRLEEEQYPYRFVPVMVSGLITDNAPPNGDISEFIQLWNQRFSNEIELELVSLDTFYEVVLAEGDTIPTYAGDWPDWWSDGVGSTPAYTKLFRDAQRNLTLVKKMNNHSLIPLSTIRQIEYQLTMYAEHTWGHSASIIEPWNTQVQQLLFRKMAYASNAHRLVFEAKDLLLAIEKGEASLAPNQSMTYRVINCNETELHSTAKLFVDPWDYVLLQNGLQVIDIDSEQPVIHQLVQENRGYSIEIPVNLKQDEQRNYRLESFPNHAKALLNNKENNGLIVRDEVLETDYVRLSWNQELGIVSWVDKSSDVELISCSNGTVPFIPIYEVTPIGMEENAAQTRWAMKLNRKGEQVQRTIGRLLKLQAPIVRPLDITLVFEYELPGMSQSTVQITILRYAPKATIRFRINKENVWHPENVYLALPFLIQDSELWVDKVGGSIRPWIDQLPGTCIDYSCVQTGVAIIHNSGGLVISMPDSPLVSFGDLEYRERDLFNPHKQNKPIELYSWIMNNYWETNFNAGLGGFYEFQYQLEWGKHIRLPQEAFNRSRSNVQDLTVIRM